jgi:hypothetical protein
VWYLCDVSRRMKRRRPNVPVSCSDMSPPGYGGGSVARRCSLIRFLRRSKTSRNNADARTTKPPTVPPAIAPTFVLLPPERVVVRDSSDVGCELCVAAWVTVRVTVCPAETDSKVSTDEDKVAVGLPAFDVRVGRPFVIDARKEFSCCCEDHGAFMALVEAGRVDWH